MTGPSGNSEFCFPRISMFPSTFSGNKIHCSPRDQSSSVTCLPLSRRGINETEQPLCNVFLFILQEVGLLEEVISPRSNLPPLLLKLSERPAEQLDYLGVSYGLTTQLLRCIHY